MQEQKNITVLLKHIPGKHLQQTLCIANRPLKNQAFQVLAFSDFLFFPFSEFPIALTAISELKPKDKKNFFNI